VCHTFAHETSHRVRCLHASSWPGAPGGGLRPRAGPGRRRLAVRAPARRSPSHCATPPERCPEANRRPVAQWPVRAWLLPPTAACALDDGHACCGHAAWLSLRPAEAKRDPGEKPDCRGSSGATAHGEPERTAASRRGCRIFGNSTVRATQVPSEAGPDPASVGRLQDASQRGRAAGMSCLSLRVRRRCPAGCRRC
jgi:hypothetical protein